jgi:tRNA-dihydrouridine synthase
MIGRAALGCPWVFQNRNPDVSLNFRLQALNRHLELIKTYGTPDWGLAGIKNHSGKYFKGLPHGSAVRQKIYRTETFKQLQELIDNLTGMQH